MRNIMTMKNNKKYTYKKLIRGIKSRGLFGCV